MSSPSLSPSYLHKVRNGGVKKKVRFGKTNMRLISSKSNMRSSKGLSPCTKTYMRRRFKKQPPSPNHEANRRWSSNIESQPVFLVAHYCGDLEDKHNMCDVDLIIIPESFWDDK